ncbi:hypothetical protein [Salipiger mangrovisoli]|uniref:Uncharacterized protein n=1 Tax=Salipiger mangrovisoli TaxID=2865933 RepID=A0ABR9X7U8_9RHOB|nr:hypothetical protein [Salipiger mangrovisoli]MBE9639588.1 hypothetical protein [Salipiger mangrovisoli]
MTLLFLVGVAAAQDPSGAEVLVPAELAPALQRMDAIRGAHVLAEHADLGALAIASTPSFDAVPPGILELVNPDDLSQLRSIELPRRAFARGLDRQRGKLCVGNARDGWLGLLDAKIGANLETIQLGQATRTGSNTAR